MTSAPSFPLLISAVQLQSLQASGRPLMVFDCSFDLAQPSAGMAQYQEAHIPGALNRPDRKSTRLNSSHLV